MKELNQVLWKKQKAEFKAHSYNGDKETKNGGEGEAASTFPLLTQLKVSRVKALLNGDKFMRQLENYA